MADLKIDSGLKSGKLVEPCDDQSCFQQIVSNGALEQCTVCGKVRDGELIRRLENNIKECEAAINRIGKGLERLTNLVVGLNMPEAVTIDSITGSVIIPPSPVVDGYDELTEEEEERLTKP